MTPNHNPTLWPHQAEAVEAATTALAAGGRAQIIMACGTGKTRTAAETSHNLSPEGRVLVVVPTLELLYQTAQQWRTHLKARLGRASAVCSLGAVEVGATVETEEIEDLENQGVLVTTDPAILHADLKADGPCVTFVTYASLPTIAALHSDHDLPPWDMVVIDEAHRSAGRHAGSWARIHHDNVIPATRRLYMTATPRLYEGNDVEVFSMDDEETFGPEVYRLDFATAIEAGLLLDYQLVVSVISDTQIAALTEGEEVISLAGNPVPAQVLAAQVALGKAIDDYKLQRVTTYHSRVQGSRLFSRTLPNALDLLDRTGQSRPVAAYDIDGSMTLAERRHILEHLHTPAGRAVTVSNCRILSEGVDVPELDAVMFVDPRHSGTDVIQAVGRALRKGSGTTLKATIIVPVMISENESAEAALEDSRFDGVWRVVRALGAHDERLVDQLSHDRARQLDNPSGEALEAPEWFITFHDRIDASFAEAIRLELVRANTSQWWESYGLARRWYSEYGHLRVPAGVWPLPGRARRGYSGRGFLWDWVSLQRQEYKRGVLPRQRRELLEQIGMVWDPREAAWEENYLMAAEHSREHNNILNPHRDDSVAKWVHHQRLLHRKGKLHAERAERLEQIGMVWDPRQEQRRARYAKIKVFKEAHGHLSPPHDHPIAKTLQGLRRDYRMGRLPSEEIQELQDLGMVWAPKESAWWAKVEAVRDYHAKHGHPDQLKDYGPDLHKWATYSRSRWAKGELSTDRIAALQGLGFTPAPRIRRISDEELVDAARRYKRLYGMLRQIPSSYTDSETGIKLGKALVGARTRYWSGTLPEETVRALSKLGMRWSRS